MGHIRPVGQDGALLAFTVAVPCESATKGAEVTVPGPGEGVAHIAFGGQTSIGCIAVSRSTFPSLLCGRLQPPWRVTVSVSPPRRVTDFVLSASVASAW